MTEYQFPAEEDFLRTASELPALSSSLRDRVLAAAQRERNAQSYRRQLARTACVLPLLAVGVWNLSALAFFTWNRLAVQTEIVASHPFAPHHASTELQGVEPIADTALNAGASGESSEDSLPHATSTDWDIVDAAFLKRGHEQSALPGRMF
jgi:hypothetical protein